MFGSDYSSVSVPPPDHIGESTPYSYNYQVLLSFVGFDLCVLATSDHTIISYGTSVHIMYFKVEYFLSIRKSFKNKSPFYSKHIFTCRHFQVRLVCGVPCWLEETWLLPRELPTQHSVRRTESTWGQECRAGSMSTPEIRTMSEFSKSTLPMKHLHLLSSLHLIRSGKCLS